MKASANIETNSMRRDITKVRVHDAIVGVLYLSSVGLAFQFGMQWLSIAFEKRGFIKLMRGEIQLKELLTK